MTWLSWLPACLGDRLNSPFTFWPGLLFIIVLINWPRCPFVVVFKLIVGKRIEVTPTFNHREMSLRPHVHELNVNQPPPTSTQPSHLYCKANLLILIPIDVNGVEEFSLDTKRKLSTYYYTLSVGVTFCKLIGLPVGLYWIHSSSSSSSVLVNGTRTRSWVELVRNATLSTLMMYVADKRSKVTMSIRCSTTGLLLALCWVLLVGGWAAGWAIAGHRTIHYKIDIIVHRTYPSTLETTVKWRSYYSFYNSFSMFPFQFKVKEWLSYNVPFSRMAIKKIN